MWRARGAMASTPPLPVAEEVLALDVLRRDGLSKV